MFGLSELLAFERVDDDDEGVAVGRDDMRTLHMQPGSVSRHTDPGTPERWGALPLGEEPDPDSDLPDPDEARARLRQEREAAEEGAILDRFGADAFRDEATALFDVIRRGRAMFRPKEPDA